MASSTTDTLPPGAGADEVYAARFDALSRMVLDIPADTFDRRAAASAAVSDALDDAAAGIRARRDSLGESLHGSSGSSLLDATTRVHGDVGGLAAAIGGDAALLRRAGDAVAGAQRSMRELAAERARVVGSAPAPGVAEQFDERARTVVDGLARTYIEVGTSFPPIPGVAAAAPPPGAATGSGAGVRGGGRPGDVARVEGSGAVPPVPAGEPPAGAPLVAAGVVGAAVDPARSGGRGVAAALPSGVTPVLGRAPGRPGAGSFPGAGPTQSPGTPVLGKVADRSPGGIPAGREVPAHRVLGRAPERPGGAGDGLPGEQPIVTAGMVPPGAPVRALGRDGAGDAPRRTGEDDAGVEPPRTAGDGDPQRTVGDGAGEPPRRTGEESPAPGPVAAHASVPERPVIADPPPAVTQAVAPVTADAVAVGAPEHRTVAGSTGGGRLPGLSTPSSSLQAVGPPQPPEAPVPPTAHGTAGAPPMMPMGAMGGMGMGAMGGGLGNAEPAERTRDVVLQEEPGAWDDGLGGAPAVLGRR